MDNLYYMIWLADDMKPKISKNYYLTSRGLTSKDFYNRNRSTCFLNKHQLDHDHIYCYETSYNIYYLKTSDIEKEDIINVEENKLGDIFSSSYKDTELDYIINKDTIFIFDYINNPSSILYSLIKKYKLKNIYSKIIFNENFETIYFYFKNSLINSANPFLIELSKCCLIGDKISSEEFCVGTYKYKKDSKNPFSIFMFPQSNLVYSNHLVEITKREFISLVKKIEEFDFDKYYPDLACAKQLNGSFYKLVVDGKCVGIVNIFVNSETFIYCECLAIFKEYRKKKFDNKLYSTYLIESLKSISSNLKKNIIVTIENDKLIKFYKDHKFKIIGKFLFD